MPTDPGSRLIRTRAMNRALGRLRDVHRDEYERYFAEELAHAQAEAEAHTAAARVQHPGEQPPVKTGTNPGPPFKPRPPMPPALLPGPPRKHGRDSVVEGIPAPDGPLPPAGRPAPRLREDVARCSYCVRFHEQGHKCAVCKSEPKAGPSKRAKEAVWAGEQPEPRTVGPLEQAACAGAADPAPASSPAVVDVAPSRVIQTVAYTSDEILDRVADLRSRKTARVEEPRPEPRTKDDGRRWGLCRACFTTITVRGDCRCTREAESA